MQTLWKSLLNETNVVDHLRWVLLVPFGRQWTKTTSMTRKSMATNKNMFSRMTHAPNPSWTRMPHHLRPKSKFYVSHGLRVQACSCAGTHRAISQQFGYAVQRGSVEKSWIISLEDHISLCGGHAVIKLQSAWNLRQSGQSGSMAAGRFAIKFQFLLFSSSFSRILSPAGFHFMLRGMDLWSWLRIARWQLKRQVQFPLKFFLICVFCRWDCNSSYQLAGIKETNGKSSFHNPCKCLLLTTLQLCDERII